MLGSGDSIDIQDVAEHKTVLFNTGNSRIAIGHEEVFNGKKILVLEDRFQEGVANKPFREAFKIAFDQDVKETVITSPGKPVLFSDFEGGKIYLSYKTPDDPVGVNVLLNGKVIGKGLLVDGKVDLKINPGLKGGWFLADNVYERAFKVAKTLVKNIK